MCTRLYTALTMLLAVVITISQATTRKVPQNFAKIQLAINAAVNGDTILIDHGNYLENIRYYGKKIIVTSRYMIDNDTTHISNTIIDGSIPSHKDTASVVTFDTGTDTLSVLCGLTIRGGKGNMRYDTINNLTWILGGGIDLHGMGGKIIHNRIVDNNVNGLYVIAGAISGWDQNSSNESSKYIIIEHNYVVGNSVNGYYAEGGAFALAMSGRVLSNIIVDNQAIGTNESYAGGISAWGNAAIVFANNIVARNFSSYSSGAFVLYASFGRTPDLTFINNTICFNVAHYGAEGISGGASLRMMNTIVWNPGDGPDITGINAIGYSNNLIRGGYYGTNTINEEPLFADTVMYRLSSLSPAIGRGSMAADLDGRATGAPVSDISGNVRPHPAGTNPDLGANESEFSQIASVGPQSTHINTTIASRNTRIFLPRAYTEAGRYFPLMIFLHGSGGTSSNAYAYGFHLMADTMNFIVASPKSLLTGWEDASEISFLETLIETLVQDYRIDPDNIFVGGYSSGGFMSYRFGLNTRKKIRGIASVAGLLSQTAEGISPAGQISLISFHSTGDAIVYYYGRAGYFNAEESLTKWMSYFGWNMKFDTLNLFDPYPQNSNTVQRISSPNGMAVFYKITGGSHAWPGPYATGHRPTIPEVNATLEIMKFFKSISMKKVNTTVNDVESIDFHALEPGTSSDTVTIHLKSTSQSPLTIQSIKAPSAPFYITNVPATPVTIPSYKHLLLNVVFNPTVPNSFNDSIVIVSNDSLNPHIRIPVEGKGISVTPAKNGVLYAIAGTKSTGTLWKLNPQTTEIEYIGSLDISNPRGLCIQSSTKKLFAFAPRSSGSYLIKINADSGNAVYSIPISISDLTAISFDGNDSLYGVTSSGRLYSIDPVTGKTVLIGETDGVVYSGLGFNPKTKKLWATTIDPFDGVYTIDMNTGIATSVGSTGLYVPAVSLSFSPGGTLYAIVSDAVGTGYLVTLDTLSGLATAVKEVPLSVQNIRSITMIPLVTSADNFEHQKIPTVFSLDQNYPNPFNPSTTIRYSLPTSSNVKLAVYDLLGREIATLVNEEQSAGWKELQWNAANVSSGIYFYKLTAGNFVEIKRMMFLK